MKTVTSLRNHSYGGRFRHTGQQYQMPDAMAIIYTKVGYVREEPQFVVKRPLPVRAVEEAAPEEPEKPKRKRRHYKRRDMRSEA